jgi:hypothetical protein
MFKSQADDKEFKIEVKKFFVDTKGSGKKEEPKQEEPKQEEPKQDTSEPVTVDAKKNIKKSAKETMDAIINDPILKKAFYKQPSLLNLIMSAIKGENPKGTGIVPAQQIVRNYSISKAKVSLGDAFDYFIPNKELTYTLISDTIEFNLSDKSSNPITFDSFKVYSAKVNEIKIGDLNLSLYDDKKDVKIIVKKENKTERKPNTFDVTFQKKYIDKTTKKSQTKSINGIITIKSKEGSGYFNGKKTN